MSSTSQSDSKIFEKLTRHYSNAVLYQKNKRQENKNLIAISFMAGIHLKQLYHNYYLIGYIIDPFEYKLDQFL